jgi:hypothetical protein
VPPVGASQKTSPAGLYQVAFSPRELPQSHDIAFNASNVLKEAKKQHEQEFEGIDHEQSWRAFKGKNLEKLIEYIIVDEVRALGLEVVNGNTLERTNANNLSRVLSQVKRNLLVEFSEFGFNLKLQSRNEPSVSLCIKLTKLIFLLVDDFQYPELTTHSLFTSINFEYNKIERYQKLTSTN